MLNKEQQQGGDTYTGLLQIVDILTIEAEQKGKIRSKIEQLQQFDIELTVEEIDRIKDILISSDPGVQKVRLIGSAVHDILARNVVNNSKLTGYGNESVDEFGNPDAYRIVEDRPDISDENTGNADPAVEVRNPRGGRNNKKKKRVIGTPPNTIGSVSLAFQSLLGQFRPLAPDDTVPAEVPTGEVNVKSGDGVVEGGEERAVDSVDVPAVEADAVGYGDEPEKVAVANSTESQTDERIKALERAQVAYKEAFNKYETMKAQQRIRRGTLGFLWKKQETEEEASIANDYKTALLQFQTEMIRYHQNYDSEMSDSDVLRETAWYIVNHNNQLRDSRRIETARTSNSWWNTVTRGTKTWVQNRANDFKQSDSWQAIVESQKLKAFSEKVAQWRTSLTETLDNPNVKIVTNSAAHTFFRVVAPGVAIALGYKALVPTLATVATGAFWEKGEQLLSVRNQNRRNREDQQVTHDVNVSSLSDDQIQQILDTLMRNKEKSLLAQTPARPWARTTVIGLRALLVGIVTGTVNIQDIGSAIHKVIDGSSVPDTVPTSTQNVLIDSVANDRLSPPILNTEGLSSPISTGNIPDTSIVSTDTVVPPSESETVQQPKSLWKSFTDFWKKPEVVQSDSVPPAQPSVDVSSTVSAPAEIPEYRNTQQGADDFTQWYNNPNAPEVPSDTEYIGANHASDLELDETPPLPKEIPGLPHPESETMIEIMPNSGDGFTQAFGRLLSNIPAGNTPDWFGDGIEVGGMSFDMSQQQLSDFAHKMGLMTSDGQSIVLDAGDKVGFDSSGRLVIERAGRSYAVTDSTGNALPGLDRYFQFKKY